MNDRVGDLRELLHQLVLHHVRHLVGVAERRIGAKPDVQVEEHVINRPARANVMAAQHLRMASSSIITRSDRIREASRPISNPV